jgi:hypothetical protein
LLMYTGYVVTPFSSGASPVEGVGACGPGCPRGRVVCAPGVTDVEAAGFCVAAGFLGIGLFCTNALGAGFRLRIGAGAPAFGVVEFGPEGGVGIELLFMVAGPVRDYQRVLLRRRLRVDAVARMEEFHWRRRNEVRIELAELNTRMELYDRECRRGATRVRWCRCQSIGMEKLKKSVD